MKIQKINPNKMKKFFKKSIASITLAIFGLSMFVPVTHAQDSNTQPVGAKWYNSSLDKTFFKIPPDDRNLEDFIFTDQKIQYRNWTDNTDSWISENAKITSSMIWYNNYIDVKNPGNGITVITNKEISNFFVVVNNKYYNTDGEFSFPIDYQGRYKIYTYWEIDENQNYCLYLDLNNKGQEKYKIKNSCHMKLLDREPFLLFFQIERVGYENPGFYDVYTTNFNQNTKEEPYYRISVTLPYLITHEEKKYVTFHKAEDFMISSLLEKYKQHYPFPNFISSFIIADGKLLQNSMASHAFNRRGNQQAFHTYSFSFVEDYIRRYDQLKSEDSNKCLKGSNTCQISLPVEGTSYFESFVLSVAAQYYNSPVVTNDKTYIGVPPVLTGEGFKPLEHENCDTLAIGCHIGNLGKSIHNTFGKIFSTIWNGFFEIIKSIFTWLYDTIIKSGPVQAIFNFFKPVWTDILEPIYNFFYGFFKPIWELATGKITYQSLIGGNQQYICSKTTGFYIDTETPASLRPSELLGFFLLFINPLPPEDGSSICTDLGIKQIDYGRSTILDSTLFLIFIFAGFWFLFFIIRR